MKGKIKKLLESDRQGVAERSTSVKRGHLSEREKMEAINQFHLDLAGDPDDVVLESIDTADSELPYTGQPDVGAVDESFREGIEEAEKAAPDEEEISQLRGSDEIQLFIENPFLPEGVEESENTGKAGFDEESEAVWGQPTGEPELADVPTAYGEPELADMPTASQEAAMTDIPTGFEELEIADMPTASQEAEMADVPTGFEELEMADVPTASQEAELADMATVSQEPELADMPTVSQEPELADMSTASQEPELADMPTAYGEPEMADSSAATAEPEQDTMNHRMINALCTSGFTMEAVNQMMKSYIDFYQVDYIAFASIMTAEIFARHILHDSVKIDEKRIDMENTQSLWILTEMIKEGEWICSDTAVLPEEQRSYFEENGIKAQIMMPIYVRQQLFGVAMAAQLEEQKAWNQEEIEMFRKMVKVTSDILKQKLLKIS